MERTTNLVAVENITSAEMGKDKQNLMFSLFMSVSSEFDLNLCVQINWFLEKPLENSASWNSFTLPTLIL